MILRSTLRRVLFVFFLMQLFAVTFAVTFPVNAATFTVSKLADTDDGTCDADCSLREAITAANAADGADAIQFVPRLDGTVTLGSALPELSTELSITGPLGGHISIDGANTYRVFFINQTGKVALRNLNITKGFTQGYGGGVYTTGTLLIENCALFNNNGESGGGLFTYAGWSSGLTTVRNCTFTNNHASRVGGGAFCYYGNSIFESCTFVGNAAPTNYGSGLATTGDTLLPTNTQVRNCIVAGNANSDIDMPFGNNQTITNNGYNLIGDGEATYLFTNHDQLIGDTAPGVEPLNNYGGPTLTMALRKGSPAINSGNTLLGNDQRGIQRPLGGNDDIGAFEWHNAMVSVGDMRVAEGSEGTTALSIPVIRTGDISEDISVQYAAANGSARSGLDFSDVSDSDGGTIGVLNLNAGETRGSINVLITGDTLNEIFESFYVVLSTPTNCTIAKGRGIVTIEDDDRAPAISVDDIAIPEGNEGIRFAVLRLKLSAPSGQVVQVQYSTRGGFGSSGAKAGEDFNTVTAGPVYFTTGSIYAYARVQINGDTTNEADERFEVNLHNAGSATIFDSIAICTILNDDRAPALTINDASIAEGNAGTTTLNFTVSLSAPSSQSITVNYATANGIARSGSDYVAKVGTLSFSAGQTSKTVTIAINGDAVVEGDETLFVLLTSATNASIGKARGSGTILNDDASG